MWLRHHQFSLELLELLAGIAGAEAHLVVLGMQAGSVLVTLRAKFYVQSSAVAFRENLLCCVPDAFAPDPRFGALGPVRTLWANTTFLDTAGMVL